MSKFKVGDRVRVIKSGRVSGGSFHGAEIGEEFTLTNVGGSFVSTNVWDFYPHEIESAYTSCAAAEVDNLADEYGGVKAKFRVGDRVRYTGKRKLYFDNDMIGCLGTVTKDNGGIVVGVDWDGPPVRSYGVYRDNLEHVAEPATLTIRAGAYYKTRDGRKVGPMILQKDSFVWFDTEPKSGYGWYDCGSVYKGGPSDERDAIAEWTDEPVAAAPKFKIGDRVANAIRGNDYDYLGTVVAVNDKRIRVKWDRKWDTGTDDGLTWFEDELRVVASKPTTIADIVARHSQTGTAIVAVLENGQPRPATRPFVHTTASAAETEANRLASINPGKEFGVYTLGAVAKVEKTYDHEWQRLASGGRKIDGIKELRRVSGLGLATAKDAVEDWLRRAA